MGGWTTEYREELVMEMAEKTVEKAARSTALASLLHGFFRAPPPWRCDPWGRHQNPPELGLETAAASGLFVDFYPDPLCF